MMSTVSRVTGDAPEAARSGATLRAARERLGWTLPEMAASLRISLTHLEALEDGHIGQLPGNAYAVGYVRSYANALGLDAAQMVRRFKAEAAEVARKTELTFPVPMPERGLPAGAVMLVGVVLCIAVYAGRPLPSLALALGSISYSLYLIHPPVGLRLLLLARRLSLPAPLGVLLGLAGSLLAAAALYRFVERPAQRWARLVPYRRRAAPSITAT